MIIHHQQFVLNFIGIIIYSFRYVTAFSPLHAQPPPTDYYGYNSNSNSDLSTVGFFSDSSQCGASNQARSFSCPSPYLPQCSPATRQAVCTAYVQYKLTEPTRLNAAPATFANVTWPASGARADLGTIVTSPQVNTLPYVEYLAKPDTYYTILLQDAGEPDVPSATRDIGTPAHWLVGNIPGSNVLKGEVIFDYFLPISPPFATLPVVYNLFVYEQPAGHISFREPRIPSCAFAGRSFFRADLFAQRYGLIGPQFGNFFQALQLSANDTSLTTWRAPCAAYFPEQFRRANLPYPITGGYTMTWPNNNIMGVGNHMQPSELGGDQPQVFALSFDTTAKFTIVLLDADTPTTATAASQPSMPYINWLVVNTGIRTLVNLGTPIIEYQRPAPPNDGKYHRFVALLYQQPNGATINPADSGARIARCDSQRRQQFDLNAFVAKNNLKLIDGAFAIMAYDGTVPC